MPDASPEPDLLFALVRERHASRLTDAELEPLRAAVDSIVELARALRTVRLRNADEPLPLLALTPPPTPPAAPSEPASPSPPAHHAPPPASLRAPAPPPRP